MTLQAPAPRLTVICVDCELVQKRFVLRFGILWYFSGMICSLFAMGCLLGQIKEPQKCGDMENNLQMFYRRMLCSCSFLKDSFISLEFDLVSHLELSPCSSCNSFVFGEN